ncbi:MAG TPA: hypothetical protein VGD78_07035 [Chthoniobacterales bacterium]
MDACFAAEAEAQHGALSVATRHALRGEKSRPLLGQIKAGLQDVQAGALAKAVSTP